MDKPLTDTIALVAGATRGGGRGIAVALGEAGATVYCTGRSSRSAPGDRPETIEQTAERVSAAGGRGVALVADHTDPDQVAAVVDRIRADAGRVDVLVNCIWGADAITEWGTPFWELSTEQGFTLLDRAIRTHIITSRAVVPLMIERGAGLVVEVTDGSSMAYRSTLFYDLAKTTVIRLAFAMAEELKDRGVTALAITPGFLRSEAMLDHFGVTEATWRDGVKDDPHFAFSETPAYLGRAVAALAADPAVGEKAGRALSTWGLQPEYGFVDADGSAPSWGDHAAGEPFLADIEASHRRFIAGLGVP